MLLAPGSIEIGQTTVRRKMYFSFSHDFLGRTALWSCVRRRGGPTPGGPPAWAGQPCGGGGLVWHNIVT